MPSHGARNYSKVRVARAARLFVITRQIKFIICGVVIAVVDAKSSLLNYWCLLQLANKFKTVTAVHGELTCCK